MVLAPLPLVQAATATAVRGLKQEAAQRSSPLAGVDIKVFQYKICPFCNKVKAVLDYFRVPYETLEVNPLTKVRLGPTMQHQLIRRHSVQQHRVISVQETAIMTSDNTASGCRTRPSGSPPSPRYAAPSH
jgi:glutaredoxin